MVRRVVGLVDEVGSGAAGPERVQRVLSKESLSRTGRRPDRTSRAARAVGRDDDVDFAVDAEAAASAKSVFEERRVEHATNARVAGSILDGLG